ncbi:MAG: type II toxin-antitoxin system prevent-host-death family antitoxin [Myxococcales bacterium]|nr:type II toxin-antitoxin system prevent-host-death family antitoxin [Myxococcales bacterium]
MHSYSTYDAKAHFSELLRRVMAGESVIVTHRGRQVAEIRPIVQADEPFQAHLDRLQRDGCLVPACAPDRNLPTLTHVPGAVARFLAERD